MLSPTVSERIWKVASDTCTPLGATIELTLRCNLRCVHCYNFDRAVPYPKERAGAELTPPEILSLLDDLARAGCLFLSLTGGEALLHPHLDEIVRRGRERRFAVRVKSNGTLLTPARVARLAEAGAMGIDVSLYGATAATHDAFTLEAGSFERSVQGIRSARDAGLFVKVSICLVRTNVHEVDEMLALVRSLAVRASIDPHISPRYDGTRDPIDLRLDRATLKDVYTGPLSFLLDPPDCRPDREVQCACARSVVAIAANGDVYPCIGAPIPSGNVRDKPFEEIWRSSPELLRIRALRLEDFTSCEPCPDRGFCRRTSGFVYTTTGVYTGPEEWTCMEANVLHEIFDERS
jgi:radical SAM protein with 4Fe4S-binding SPASM domain